MPGKHFLDGGNKLLATRKLKRNMSERGLRIYVFGCSRRNPLGNKYLKVQVEYQKQVKQNQASLPIHPRRSHCVHLCKQPILLQANRFRITLSSKI